MVVCAARYRTGSPAQHSERVSCGFRGARESDLIRVSGARSGWPGHEVSTDTVDKDRDVQETMEEFGRLDESTVNMVRSNRPIGEVATDRIPAMQFDPGSRAVFVRVRRLTGTRKGQDGQI